MVWKKRRNTSKTRSVLMADVTKQVTKGPE